MSVVEMSQISVKNQKSLALIFQNSKADLQKPVLSGAF